MVVFKEGRVPWSDAALIAAADVSGAAEGCGRGLGVATPPLTSLPPSQPLLQPAEARVPPALRLQPVLVCGAPARLACRALRGLDQAAHGCAAHRRKASCPLGHRRLSPLPAPLLCRDYHVGAEPSAQADFTQRLAQLEGWDPL